MRVLLISNAVELVALVGRQLCDGEALRRILRVASAGANLIETVWGRGYRLAEPQGHARFRRQVPDNESAQ